MTVLELQVPSQTSVEARAQTPRAVTPWATTSRARSPRAITPRAQSPRGQTPAPAAKGKSVAIKSPSPDSSDSEGSPAPSESSLSSPESELEEQLSWGEDSFKSLKRFVNKAIKKHLDITKCRSQQDHKALDTVCDLAIAEFPDLGTFENCWPVLDLVQMRLKYLSSRVWQKKRITDSEVAKHAGQVTYIKISWTVEEIVCQTVDSAVNVHSSSIPYH
ncbi:hypothetical protein F5141DRAFT_1214119 [Pisolithus sp. B1]|nr:hypothetical protein F5141DRAFT_1214119 [Pisolithus sp. B1]